MNVGIFLHFDWTLQGMIHTELDCYNKIFDNPNIDKIYVFDYKGKYSNMCKDFKFDYTRVLVSSIDDVEKFKKVDILFSWDGYQDFFAGTISPKAIEVYKIFSIFTNEFDRKIYFRICDSKHFMKDYKLMVKDRCNSPTSGQKFIERNGFNATALDSINRLNYENVYFLCNGNRNICDWSWMTLTHSIPFLTEEYVKSHSVYLSDDILFQYTENYDKFNLSEENERINTLYNVGNLNGGKVKKIKHVMKKSDVKLVLRTPERSLNAPLRSFPNIKMLEAPIYREDMYKELNKYQAYLFVGKGDDFSVYFNKTMYDASIAKTVFLIYSKVDETNIYHELSDYVFSDEKELLSKFEWIKTNYSDHLKKQREVLIKNLSNDVFNIFEKN